MLLLSTVTGGLVIRGAFTGAIADELRKSDGQTDIYSMFTLAVNKLVRSKSLQRPEMRSTADKFLVLPPALNNAAKSTATAGDDNSSNQVTHGNVWVKSVLVMAICIWMNFNLRLFHY